MLFQFMELHRRIRKGFKTNHPLGQLLITSLHKRESIVEISIVVSFVSLSHTISNNPYSLASIHICIFSNIHSCLKTNKKAINKELYYLSNI